MGALVIYGARAELYYRQLQGSCNQTQVEVKDFKDFIDTLIDTLHKTLTAKAAKAAPTAQEPQELMVIVLDNAPFHKSTRVKSSTSKSPSGSIWQRANLFLRYLPAYCPQLNYIENVWRKLRRKLKGFLMPRRYYDSISELKEALLAALKALGATQI